MYTSQAMSTLSLYCLLLILITWISEHELRTTRLCWPQRRTVCVCAKTKQTHQTHWINLNTPHTFSDTLTCSLTHSPTVSTIRPYLPALMSPMSWPEQISSKIKASSQVDMLMWVKLGLHTSSQYGVCWPVDSWRMSVIRAVTHRPKIWTPVNTTEYNEYMIYITIHNICNCNS